MNVRKIRGGLRWTAGLLVVLMVASCGGGRPPTAGEPDPTIEPYEPPVEYRPDLEPNRWERLRDDAPNSVYETAVTYDPVHHRVLRHGGHYPRSAAQTPYTLAYDPLQDAFSELAVPRTPQRMCLVQGTWVESKKAFAVVAGIVSHGSVPMGRYDENFVRIEPYAMPGPFLLHVEDREWEMAQPDRTDTWPRRALHRDVAYDRSSDAVFGLMSKSDQKHLYFYDVHRNEVGKFPLPEELWGRLFYAIAVDPDRRLLALFGGQKEWRGDRASDLWLFDLARREWRRGSSGPPGGLSGTYDFLNPVLAYHGPSGNFLLFVRDVPGDADPDTVQDPGPLSVWRYDIEADRWEQLPTQNPPPFMGEPVYAENLDAVFLWGGGPDKVGNHKESTSTSLWVLRPRLPGARVPPAPTPSLRVLSDGVELLWAAEPGATYEVARAEVDAIPGAYRIVGSVTASSETARFLDGPQDRLVAYRIRRAGSRRWSLARFNAPAAPSAPEVTVDPDGSVQVAVKTRRGLRYVVERVHGTQAFEPVRTLNGTGDWVRFREAGLVQGGSADEPVWRYRVAAYDPDQPGVLSGYGPAASTLPPAPRAFRVEQLGNMRVHVTWTPRSPHEKLRVWYNNYFCNARASLDQVYVADFKDLGAHEGASFDLELPPIGPDDRDPQLSNCPSGGRHHYFYARVENAKGQLGFYSDLRSPTDPVFHVPGER